MQLCAIIPIARALDANKRSAGDFTLTLGGASSRLSTRCPGHPRDLKDSGHDGAFRRLRHRGLAVLVAGGA